METHPTKVIQTEHGNIVMSKPDLLRTSALSNSIYSYILTDEELLAMNSMASDKERNDYMQVKVLKRGYTVMQLTMLAYVTSAPFHLNDYLKDPILDLESFLGFADMDLINRMSATMKELGTIDPLSP